MNLKKLLGFGEKKEKESVPKLNFDNFDSVQSVQNKDSINSINETDTINNIDASTSITSKKEEDKVKEKINTKEEDINMNVLNSSSNEDSLLSLGEHIKEEENISNLDNLILNHIEKKEKDIELENEKLFLNEKNLINTNEKFDDFDHVKIGKDDTILNLDKQSYNTKSKDLFSDEILEENHKRLPLIGKLPVTKQYQIGAAITILAFVGIVIGGFLYGNGNSQENRAIQTGTEFSADIQKINTYFTDAVLGKNNGYNNLVKIVSKTDADFNGIKQNSTFSNNPDLQNIQNRINTNLNNIKKNIEILHNQSEILVNGSEKVDDFSKHTNQINTEIDNFLKLYLQQSLNQNELTNAYSLKTNLQVINGSLAIILLSDKVDNNVINTLNKSKQEFKNSLLALQVGDSARAINPINQNLLNNYQIIARDWVSLSSKADNVINKTAELIQTRNLSPKNEQIITALNQDVNAMLDLYKTADLTGVQFAKIVIIISIFILLLSILIIFYIYSFEKDNRSLFEKVENNKNQTSILQLLNEMIPLQDGDLTKKTTVTEEITGAIADSINATIDSLASLVKKIKDTSSLMTKKTNEVNIISLEMLKISENQTSSLLTTGTEVITIAGAITEIAKKTEQGAEEARRSAQVSEEGAKQVQDSLKSMRGINENMNETVHLMKKVGASSKQISEIVELLSDITEETSILALNATVQAAKAGDAGKGFKIVADSIQDLAYKAGDAARRVGALISAVQTDVQAVENAVEKTTEEVNNGVKLSELAGESLNKMTIVSKELSEIVSIISYDAKSHAESAKKVNESMREILKTTEENKISTEKTANSISEISEISTELGESVQSFKVE